MRIKSQATQMNNTQEDAIPQINPVLVKQEDTPADNTTPPKRKPRNYSAWYQHVNKVKNDNPDMKHVDAVRFAKQSYTKAPKAKRDTTGHRPNPWMKHIKGWMSQNPEWRKTHSYKEVLKKLKLTYKRV